jgi:hypothetical protein
MSKDNMFMIFFIFFILFFSYQIYLRSDYFQLVCIVSSIDGDKYCVRDRNDLEKASDLLAETGNKLETLIEYLEKKYPDDYRVLRLNQKFNKHSIVETLPTSQYTAYSENKGEKVALCLNKNKNNNNELIDKNTLLFVAIHEIAHISTKSHGHTKEFWSNFKFLLVEAKEANLYVPVDYSIKHKKYCSMNITSNPYFN